MVAMRVYSSPPPQAAATAGLIKDREAEVAGLAEAARELAARSDDGATIGKLQSALLATQVRRGSGSENLPPPWLLHCPCYFPSSSSLRARTTPSCARTQSPRRSAGATALLQPPLR